jgi:hypothetical protein
MPDLSEKVQEGFEGGTRLKARAEHPKPLQIEAGPGRYICGEAEKDLVAVNARADGWIEESPGPVVVEPGPPSPDQCIFKEESVPFGW